MKEYTEEQKAFILSKIKKIEWSQISEVLRDLWVNLMPKN